MIAFSTASRLAVRLIEPSPMSTHGVPPMRSRVQNAKPLTLSFALATATSTQASACLDSCPISKRWDPSPPRSAISANSASLSAVQSLVSTSIAIHATPAKTMFLRPLVQRSARQNCNLVGGCSVLGNHRTTCSDEDGVGPEQHAQLGHKAIGRVDAEVVGQPQHLTVVQVQKSTGESPGMLGKERLQRSISPGWAALADSRTRTGGRNADFGDLENVDLVGDELRQVVSAVDAATHAARWRRRRVCGRARSWLRGNTMTSNEVTRSSSSKTAMSSPLLVHFLWRSGDDAPDPLHGAVVGIGELGSVQSVLRRSAASAPISG